MELSSLFAWEARNSEMFVELSQITQRQLKPFHFYLLFIHLSSYSQSIGFSDNRSTMSYENFSFSCIQNIASACFMCGAVSFLQIWEVGMILLQANLNRFTKQDESSSQKSLAVISIRFFPRPESAAAPFWGSWAVSWGGACRWDRCYPRNGHIGRDAHAFI